MFGSASKLVALLLAIQAFMVTQMVNARLMNKAHLHAKQAAAMKDFVSKASSSTASRPAKTNNITFSNPRAAGVAINIDSVLF
jgi:hypothetical protein